MRSGHRAPRRHTGGFAAHRRIIVRSLLMLLLPRRAAPSATNGRQGRGGAHTQGSRRSGQGPRCARAMGEVTGDGSAGARNKSCWSPWARPTSSPAIRPTAPVAVARAGHPAGSRAARAALSAVVAEETVTEAWKARRRRWVGPMFLPPASPCLLSFPATSTPCLACGERRYSDAACRPRPGPRVLAYPRGDRRWPAQQGQVVMCDACA